MAVLWTIIPHLLFLYARNIQSTTYLVYNKYSKPKLNCVYHTFLDLPSSETLGIEFLVLIY